MAFTFLSRFRIRPDKEAEFVALTREMEALAPSEPGTLGYRFYRLAEPGMFAVYESFTDEAADKAHMEYAHNKPLIERMIACMDGSYTREMLYDIETGEG
ncbi:putative quinol monooxygenase [Novosphingobium cyanobacteriorum]|uniref:Antibiotic biosynthesis monooxygenase n=1 Tax=Novosphingobium cyanobacteriorum TaxID=3024215 RepID=A0ABT6CL42_9SPHN|nr:antibiotic biosynthesis monooxygenase family protein [Novosphingobium cyanobacteriorum]MDF8334649.1 antibiotic biosynthesis monooxygenase [Novosphingobium cyanobacteriorum]